MILEPENPRARGSTIVGFLNRQSETLVIVEGRSEEQETPLVANLLASRALALRSRKSADALCYGASNYPHTLTNWMDYAGAYGDDGAPTVLRSKQCSTGETAFSVSCES